MFLTRLKTTAALLAAGMSLILASAFVVPAFPRLARSEPAPAKPPPDDRPSKVAVETLATTNFQLTTTQVAKVQAFESVELAPRISGYLKNLRVDIGDAVKRGDVLAEIDAPELVAAKDRSQAVVEQAQARVAKAEAAVAIVEASLVTDMAKAEAAAAVEARAESLLRFREKSLARYKGLAANKAVGPHVVEEEEEHAEAARSTLLEARAQAATARAGIDEGKAKLRAANSGITEALGRPPRRQG